MKHNDSVLLTDGNDVISKLEAPLHHIYMDDSMRVIHINDNSKSSDLYMYYCGISSCEPGHSFGPAIREHYVIHYITRGEGTLVINNQEYHLHANQGFLLSPGIVSKYKASTSNPWEYIWVGFHGLNAASYLKLANITPSNPVFTYDKDKQVENILTDMVKTYDKFTFGTTLRMQSYLYHLLAELIDNNTAQLKLNATPAQYKYVRKALEYIQMNYMSDMNVNKLAEYLNLNRSYLCSIFKKFLNISPQSYIAQYRINKACELLQNTTYSVADIAQMTGYKDYAVFQRYFKKSLGMSPTKYREDL